MKACEFHATAFNKYAAASGIEEKEFTPITWLPLEKFLGIGVKPDIYEILEFILNDYILKKGINRIVLDPIFGLIKGSNDVDNVRPVLSFLTKVGMKYGVNFEIGMNTNKNEGTQSLIHRGAGSFGFAGVAKTFEYVETCQVGSMYRTKQDSPHRSIVAQCSNKWAKELTHTLYERAIIGKQRNFCMFPAFYVDNNNRTKFFNLPPTSAGLSLIHI